MKKNFVLLTIVLLSVTVNVAAKSENGSLEMLFDVIEFGASAVKSATQEKKQPTEQKKIIFSENPEENQHLIDSLKKTIARIEQIGYKGMIDTNNNAPTVVRLNKNYSTTSFRGIITPTKEGKTYQAIYTLLIKNDPEYNKFTDFFYVWFGEDDLRDYYRADKKKLASMFTKVDVGPVEEDPAPAVTAEMTRSSEFPEGGD